MGRVKAEWMESQERGWDTDNKYVCIDCVDDMFLKETLSENLELKKCDYCLNKSDSPIAAHISVIMEPISYTLNRYFSDPSSAGLPRDSGEWIGGEKITYTSDALMSIGLECDDDLFCDIAGSFSNDAWYPCANGYWLDIHEHEELQFGWNSFVEEVKHRTRYFFTTESEKDYHPREKYTPLDLLNRIGQIIDELDLVKQLKLMQSLYRVRHSSIEHEYAVFDDVGPPPDILATSGRMNPAGISYFYLAYEPETAIAEVIQKPPVDIVLAKFKTKKELNILDLTELPDTPSIFDLSLEEDRESIIFLKDFIKEIVKPVAKYNSIHIEYVPSQIVCEYIHKAFKSSDGLKLDGIKYLSAIRNEGVNLVLFPPREFDDTWEDLLKLESIDFYSLKDWNAIKNSI